MEQGGRPSRNSGPLRIMPTPRLCRSTHGARKKIMGHTHLGQGVEEGQGDNLPGGKVWSWPFHQMTFANAITSLLLILFKKKCYTPFPPNEIGKMIDNMLFMLATQFWGSLHINRIYGYYQYNSACPGFSIKFRNCASSTGVRGLWKASGILQAAHGAGFGKYFYFPLSFIHFPDTIMNFVNDGLCRPSIKRLGLRPSVRLFLLKWDSVWKLRLKCKKKKKIPCKG